MCSMVATKQLTSTLVIECLCSQNTESSISMAQSHRGGEIRSYTTKFKVEAVKWLRITGMQNILPIKAKNYSVDQIRV